MPTTPTTRPGSISEAIDALMEMRRVYGNIPIMFCRNGKLSPLYIEKGHVQSGNTLAVSGQTVAIISQPVTFKSFQQGLKNVRVGQLVPADDTDIMFHDTPHRNEQNQGVYLRRKVQVSYLRPGYVVKLNGVVSIIETVKGDDTHTHISIKGVKRVSRIPNDYRLYVGIPYDMMCEEHDWTTNPCGLIDTCSICGESRA